MSDYTECVALCPFCEEWEGLMITFRVTVDQAVEFCDFDDDGNAQKFKSVPNTGAKEDEMLKFWCQLCGAEFDEPEQGREIDGGSDD